MSEITVHLAKAFNTAVEASPRVLEVASMFGLGVDEARMMTIVPECRLILRPAQIVYVTGPSGSGKSTILGLVAEAVPDAVNFSAIIADDKRPLIDQLGSTLEEAARFLAIAGLADAFVMLRSPLQLSDGQRYRFRLAQLIDRLHRRDPAGTRPMTVVLADEFGATLDRMTAMVVARNIRRWVDGAAVCFVCATTHEDLLEPLDPDVLLYKPLGGTIEIHERSSPREERCP